MDNGASSYRRFREEGDASGLAEIIRDYKDGLILYLSSLVGDVRTAEELAEDTFVLLGTKKPRDKGKSSFRTWLYRIGHNVAVDYLRRTRKGDVPLDECAELTDEERDLEASYLRDERKQAVHHALRQLKPEYRQALWLIYFEGFSCQEAATVLKKSVHSVETLLYRARNALRLQLQSEGFEYEDQ